MAAYASVVSLMNTIDNIQNHPRFSTSIFDEKQVGSLGEKLDFLLDFIESNHSRELLDSQIACAAHAAEDVIESHVVDQIHYGRSISSLDVQTLIEDMDSVKEKVVNFKEEMGFKSRQVLAPTYSLPAASSSNGKSRMVGFDDELFQLLDALTGKQSSLRIIPIVGMGGIGKTTLARNAYENRLTLDHFDIRAWVTISQEYSVKDIFSKLLTRQSDQYADEQQLAQEFYQSLIGRRYLIILDDIWNIDVWDKIKFFFPDNNNQSRIILTTRLSNVAVHFGSSYFSLKFLDEDNSWKLFCEKAFPQEGCSCPPELEEIGRKIAEKCKGLPLLIVVIGAFLGKSSRTKEYWENISENINSIYLKSADENEQSLDILSLSYSHLPAHLKPCFLYIGVFPEDREILVSQLIKLWVAEGFIKPNKTQTLEEVAEYHLKDLVDRNLLLVRKMGSTRNIKTCMIHDLVRDLCIKEADKERFFSVMRVNIGDHICIDKECHVVCHEEILKSENDRRVHNALESASLVRSFITNRDFPPTELKLLRVLSVSGSTQKILEQVNLRYVSVHKFDGFGDTWIRHLSPSVSRVWNMQTLIKVRDYDPFIAPSEIWEMSQLRHLEFNNIYLRDPPLSRGDFVLRNLQTVKGVINWRLSEEVCKRIPNLKKLKTFYVDLSERSSRRYCYYNIGLLHKLESLYCSFGDKPDGSHSIPNLITLPSSLKKLTLEGCWLDHHDLRIIGLLPHLQVLKLQANSIVGSVWDPVEGGFRCLKFLKIYSCRNLKYWNADSSHFPVLENLKLVGMYELSEVPSGVGEIPTLGAIELVHCSVSAAISAVKLLEEQESLGNEGLLHVRIEFWYEGEIKRFSEEMEDQFQSFTSDNLQLDYC